MKKIMLIAASMLLLAGQANAQLSLGVGYRHSSEASKSGDLTAVKKFNGGFFLAQYNFKLVAGLGIAPGIEFGCNSSNKPDSDGYYDSKYFDLIVPVDLNYQFVVSEKLGIGFTLGGFADCTLNNQSKIDLLSGGTAEIKWSGSTDDYLYKMWNYGFKVGVNFDIIKKIRISLMHEEGLRDLSRVSQFSTKRRACMLGVAYVF